MNEKQIAANHQIVRDTEPAACAKNRKNKKFSKRSEPNIGKIPSQTHELNPLRGTDPLASQPAQPPQSGCRVFMRCARIRRQFAFRHGSASGATFFKKVVFLKRTQIKSLISKR